MLIRPWSYTYMYVCKRGICDIQEATRRGDKRPGEEAGSSPRVSRQTTVTAATAAGQSRSQSVVMGH